LTDLQVFLGVLMGSLNLGNAVPLFENFANARAAASTLFKCIDAVSTLFRQINMHIIYCITIVLLFYCNFITMHLTFKDILHKRVYFLGGWDWQQFWRRSETR